MGFTAIERDIASTPPPATPKQEASANIVGQQFMLYHNAVMTYAQSLLDKGQWQDENIISASDLQPGITVPAGAVAVIARTSTAPSIASTNNVYGSYVVCIWMPAPAGTAALTANQFGRDLTIGTVTADGQHWVPAVAEGANSPTPNPFPIGCTAALNESIWELPWGSPQVSPPKSGDLISVFGLEGN